MKILIASDKFKGSLTAPQACESIRKGLTAGLGDDLDFRISPVADGGDGMARSITSAKSGAWIKAIVDGPLGDPVEAGYGLVDNGRTAVIEMAEASGLWLLGSREKNPWVASTRGTGQLIANAIEAGASEILLGIGGSATNDGGTGMASALGYRFLDSKDRSVSALPHQLEDVSRVEPPDNLDSLPRITVACDVVNPLLGPSGCTRIYGPQKGILPDQLEKHEDRLEHLVRLLGDTGEKAAEIPGSGAAGGLGFGALAFFGARLVPGFDLVAETLDLAKQVDWADIVITGEGKLDAQSLEGKAPAGVATMAREMGKPIFAFCGMLGDGEFADLFAGVFEIDRGDRTVEESMKEGSPLLSATAERAAPLIGKSSA